MDFPEDRLTMVLVGPRLRRRMSMAALDALAQRIVRARQTSAASRATRWAPTSCTGCASPERRCRSSSADRRGDLPGVGGLRARPTASRHQNALFAAADRQGEVCHTEHVQAALQEVT